jgi:hypothetical protein
MGTGSTRSKVSDEEKLTPNRFPTSGKHKSTSQLLKTQTAKQ